MCRSLTRRAPVAYSFASALRYWSAGVPPAAPNGTRRERVMSEASTVALSPETVLAQMKQNGITDIVWLPDSETNWLYLLMQSEPSLRLVGVSREGHACSIAARLVAGGRKAVI